MKLYSATGRVYFDSEDALANIEKNNGVYVKRIKSNTRVWKFFDPKEDRKWAYGLEQAVAEWLFENAQFIEYRETDTGLCGKVSVTHFKERAVREQLGGFGWQYFIRLDQMDEVVEPQPKKAKKVVVPKPKKVKTWSNLSLFG